MRLFSTLSRKTCCSPTLLSLQFANDFQQKTLSILSIICGIALEPLPTCKCGKHLTKKHQNSCNQNSDPPPPKKKRARVFTTSTHTPSTQQQLAQLSESKQKKKHPPGPLAWLARLTPETLGTPWASITLARHCNSCLGRDHHSCSFFLGGRGGMLFLTLPAC